MTKHDGTKHDGTRHDWVEHRRSGDRELLGWIRAAGDGFVAIDRLGRELGGETDWLAAEELLEERGLRWLADLWQLTSDDGTRERVRIVEARPDRVVVALDDLGSVDAPHRTLVLPFPAPDSLAPFDGDRHTLPAGWGEPLPPA